MDAYTPYKITTILLILTTALVGIAGYLNSAFHLFVAVTVAHLLVYVHTMTGFYILERYFEAENKLFFRAVFGGMALRMAITLIITGLIISISEIHKFSFTVSLVISYILYSVIEMIYIYKNLEATTDKS